MQRLGVLAVLALGIAGCSLTAKPVRYFELRPTRAERQAGPPLPSILVPDFGCVAAYDQLRLVIRKSAVEFAASRNLQWTTAPGRMLAQGLRARLEGTGRFETVRREATPRPPYTVEGLVQTIELSEEQAPTVQLALHLNIRRSNDGTVIDEASIDEARPVGSRDPAASVLVLRDLYSQVLAGVTDRIISAIERDLARPATAAAP
ncbi:MAG TPA: ABC-type transport auxiliary lipoprotein family protein [Candidatus Binatia bacterium]|nr:ABC-type transport auxiliary lipoprotein family protein [Candidatus Binatia bacterium]